jgi:hypothetical protein
MDIKNLRDKYWGVPGGNVTSALGVNDGALKSNGLLGSQIELGNYSTACLSSSCTISIGLWLKYWPTTVNSQNQTFLDIQGMFTLFQPESSTQLAIKMFTKRDYVCNYVFNSTTHIWSQFFVTLNAADEVNIYKNGILLTEFVTKQCEVEVNPARDPNGLITLSNGGALAEYDDLVIWNTGLSVIQIADIFKSYTG